MKRTIALFLTLVLLLAVTACAANPAAASQDAATTAAAATATAETVTTADTTAQPAELTKVRFLLDWTPNTNHTGLYVAQELGLYKDAGLDVEIVQPTEGGALSLVAAGKADFCVSFQEEIASALTSSQPLPITAVAALIQHNTSGIISLAENSIVTPKAMENHVYASWDTPIEKAILSAIAKADGGSYDKIKVVPNTVTDVVAALQTDVDMVWVYYAWDGIATELASLKTNFINFGQVNPALDFYTPVLASSNDYLAKNPEIARKFLAATAKGYEYAISNPDDAAAILVKNAPGMDIQLAKKSQAWLKDQYKAEVANWGQIDTARWDRFYTWMYDQALIEKKIGSGEGFTNDYLPN
ncbi:MAG: ABC-type nitrate/sulfonate/bicarbonate transport system, periplasmic component [Firmicutes bacterium]|nr:ABC-type nitrate/sulfonate/bicarbonate transport system, periplasmic component [Bacillota bacterium]